VLALHGEDGVGRDYGKEGEVKYLTDDELNDVAERSCLRDMERAIADAASDKGYAEGQAEGRKQAAVDLLEDAIAITPDEWPVVITTLQEMAKSTGTPRSALRAERDMLRKALESSQSEMAILRGALRGVLEWMPVLAKIEEAISEAGK
jgi:hypothetical protein